MSQPAPVPGLDFPQGIITDRSSWGVRLPDPVWQSDETCDFFVRSGILPAGGGPTGSWPECQRVFLACTLHGPIAHYPEVTDIVDLILKIENHYRERHG